VFFGSAINNFGVQLLLDGFLKHAPGRGGRFGVPKSRRDGRHREGGSKLYRARNPAFSGFIFKIQANMDPKHRDRIAFVRVCSGKFERDMTVHHSRSEKKVRLSSSHKLFGNERETVDEAYPGDVIGLVGHDSFGIGDTLTTDPKILYKEIPRFTPEAFSYLHNPNTAKYKQFRQGLDQLMQEGVIQALYLRNSSVKTPLLAAVGPLQFEVVQFRLESEYGAVSRLEAAPWTVVRWLPADMKEDDLDALSLPTGARSPTTSAKIPSCCSQRMVGELFWRDEQRVPLSALPVQTAKGVIWRSPTFQRRARKGPQRNAEQENFLCELCEFAAISALRSVHPKMSTILTATEITVRYGDRTVLDAATLGIDEGDRIGLVGRNGCGKTTFLRILAGLQSPDSGDVTRRRELVVSYLPQDFMLDAAKNVLENIRDGREARARFDRGI
jgi:ABC-type multidrug transport system fused ATPase/permease subunit